MEKSLLETLKKYYQEHEAVFYDESTGEILISDDLQEVLDTVNEANKNGYHYKRVNQKYLLQNGIQVDRKFLEILDELQEKRYLDLNYSEYLITSEFLFLHDSEFKVTKINSDQDTLRLHLL